MRLLNTCLVEPAPSPPRHLRQPLPPGRLRPRVADLDRRRARPQMYDVRDFALMPILGDALQDAGCDNADILDHCRAAARTSAAAGSSICVLGKE